MPSKKICIDKKVILFTIFILTLVGGSIYLVNILSTSNISYKSKAAAPTSHTFYSTGTVIKTHIDDFKYNNETTKYELITDKGRFTITNPSREIINMTSGSKISIKGSVTQSIISQENTQIIKAASTQSTTGTKKIAIVQAAFSDVSLKKIDKSTISDYFNSNVLPYFKENSFGLLDYQFDLFDPLRLSEANSCDFSHIANSVNARLQNVRLIDYDILEFIIPEFAVGCSYGGVSTGVVINGRAIPAIFINQNYVINSSVVIHELSHSLGAGHAEVFYCGSKTIDYGVSYDDLNCTIRRTITNFFDVMNPRVRQSTPQLGGYYKQYIGWIPQKNVVTVEKSGTYTLYPTENKPIGTDPHVLKIPLPNTTYSYYLEYRNRTGFDKALPDTAKGVILNIGPFTYYRGTSNSIALLDTTPFKKDNDFYDVALKPQHSFVDSFNGISISIPQEQEAFINGGIRINITITDPISRYSEMKVDFTDTTLSSARFYFLYKENITLEKRDQSLFTIDMSLDPKMGDGTYWKFTFGGASPITETNPKKWDQYICGKTLYWQITSPDGIKSPIQQAVVCGK